MPLTLFHLQPPESTKTNIILKCPKWQNYPSVSMHITKTPFSHAFMAYMAHDHEAFVYIIAVKCSK